MSRADYREEISNIRLATSLARKENEIRLKLGTRDQAGKLHVEYRSKAGKLGVYLLLREIEVDDKYTGRKKKRCLLGFANGAKLADGKDGFWVDREQVNFGPAKEEPPEPPRDPQVPGQWPRPIEDDRPEPVLQDGVNLRSPEHWPQVRTPFDDDKDQSDLPF